MILLGLRRRYSLLGYRLLLISLGLQRADLLLDGLQTLLTIHGGVEGIGCIVGRIGFGPGYSRIGLHLVYEVLGA